VPRPAQRKRRRKPAPAESRVGADGSRGEKAAAKERREKERKKEA